MNEWLKKLGESAKAAWAKWSKIQKGIIIGIAIAIIIAVAALFRVSSTPTTVRLFNAPVTGDMQSQILTRLDQENVEATVNDAGYISVPDEKTAIKMREILISEGLVPAVVDPWASFFDRGWSTTDADQNQKKKLAIERALTQHIQAIDDVASADVRLSLPEDKLFKSEQDRVRASVLIRAKPMSDLYTNRRRILGIQRLIVSAVEGLTPDPEYCVITDSEGKETVITYAEMESITFVEQADYGEPVDGLTTGVFAKHMEGTFRSEMFGEYTVCGDPKIVCAIRIQTAENVYVINMESDESTARLYEAMIERVKSE